MARKYWKVAKAKPGQLLMEWGAVSWDRSSPDLQACWELPSQKGDAIMLLDAFYHAKLPGEDTTLIEELEKRGYDLTTLKFSVMKKEITDGGSKGN